MLNRRKLLVRTAGFAVFGLSLGKAAAAGLPGIEKASMRGSINAAELGVQPGTFDDQSKAFAKLLREAGDRDMPVFLQPGTYVVSNLTLPGRVRLTGVPGATRIVYGGDGHLFMAEQADHIELSGIVLDGSNRSMGDYAQGLLDLRRVAHLIVDNCQITGSGKNGLALEHAAGRVERTEISGAADAGIYSVEAAGLAITGNTVSDCANGGILVHRWQAAEDGTIVTGNRVERIAARGGGTGQNGNGINAFRAANVIISGNIVSDCAFSAIRANSASNLQVSGNTCMRSGETAVYSEFSFEGAVISNNVVDGAANGISIVNFNEGGRMGVCSGNIVRNLSTSGPYPADPPGFGVGIGVEADTTVSNNVVENAPLYGMQIGWGPYLRNVVATGNIIRKAGTGIVVSVVDGAGTAIISDNVIDGARNGAIVGQRWAEPATGDLTSSDKTGFTHLTVERNHVS
ncbi:TIGR03808 family TAT-translocated repetitive protein [Mesorhizobium sp. BR1-1-9]|uniref:TIGR03808 family TAT-translocated repetitive protein n=1 Tax=unclassified Mesorhizobium TaxID=325217 RepID=UPI001CD09B6D|nr:MULTISPECIES: TIGR03808 family TAT-translocated repetitive protein [unclassified Mesorhizobium]MBZ9872640.1 TIGR03808 family TAT-translocated repetitive protein [Mesorhizobium sp. BR1-1-9]MBZ9940432.1 TIGR03808 family TAT-translocated repetitive protein [Mesorhizobium sp. BR1-1-13]